MRHSLHTGTNEILVGPGIICINWCPVKTSLCLITFWLQYMPENLLYNNTDRVGSWSDLIVDVDQVERMTREVLSRGGWRLFLLWEVRRTEEKDVRRLQSELQRTVHNLNVKHLVHKSRHELPQIKVPYAEHNLKKQCEHAIERISLSPQTYSLWKPTSARPHSSRTQRRTFHHTQGFLSSQVLHHSTQSSDPQTVWTLMPAIPQISTPHPTFSSVKTCQSHS